MNLLLVAIGAAVRAGGRYLLGGWLQSQLGTVFPWGTFAVSVLGSLVIGVVLSLTRQQALSTEASLFLTVGVLGGFTTFSVLSYETVWLIESGAAGASLLNVLGQLVASILAVYLGFALGRIAGA